MAKKLLILLVVFVFTACVFSCRKEHSHELPSLSSIAQTLQYKWGLMSITEFSSSGIDSLRYNGTDSDYFNFLVNDSVYIYSQQSGFGGIYALLNDTTLLIGDGVSFDTTYIKALTPHLLVISQPNPTGGPTVDSLER